VVNDATNHPCVRQVLPIAQLWKIDGRIHFFIGNAYSTTA